MVRRRLRPRGVLIAAAIAVVAIGSALAYVLLRPISSVARVEQFDVPQASPEQLERVAGLRVFVAHQSVGRDLLAAVPDVYRSAGVAPPGVSESTPAAVAAEPGIVHVFIGENGDPLGKIAAFDGAIRSGLGDVVDVAMLKFCYSDFHAGDDVETVFATYRDTLAALERDYPGVVFVHATTSVTAEGTTGERAKDRIKPLLGRSKYWPSPSHNVARARYNALVRAEYAASGRLFDLAAVQATSPNGERELREYHGSLYDALRRAMARDYGHMTSAGSEFVARALLATLADAAAGR